MAEEAKKETLSNNILKSLTCEKIITANIFRTAYKIAKGNHSFNNFEMEIDLQEINGVEMGRTLHSTNACIHIINHIGNKMRKKIITEVIKSKSKISIIIDESTTISQKSTLIVYIQCCVKGSGMNSPINLFLDLVELESVTAKGLFDALRECLHSYGMKDEYLKHYLVSVACDGTAVILGCKSGVFKLITEKLLTVIVWYCANYRLDLSVGNTIREISSINRFKSFLDKLRRVSCFPKKNRRELRLCEELLDIQLLKIGRILNAR
ncbi:E3 SUMO-protein ligase KIAA1586-like [Hydra vulgaris]|uniref:E3 SUMO-protein ligase KIAA1586-like n=1 Tax=Hydra vulgaris TaxID=6087 RepID=A0ABM4DMF3_HYDVU